MDVRITTAAGLSLHGELRQTQPTRQLLVICHGLNSSKDHPALKTIATSLYQKGHAVFTFNFTRDTLGLNVPQQVQDIQAVIAQFKEFDEIILLAGSFGALSACAVAASSPKIAGLVTLNGFFGSPHLGPDQRRRFRAFKMLALGPNRYRTIWRYVKTHVQPHAITVPVLVIHSAKDQVVYIEQSRRFFAALPGTKKFLELTKSDHDLSIGNETATVTDTIDRWVSTACNH